MKNFVRRLIVINPALDAHIIPNLIVQTEY